MQTRGPSSSVWQAPLGTPGALVLAVLLWAGPGRAAAQETDEYFKTNCANCHTIGGGRLAGPDLKDVSQRRDRAWLVRFVTNPKATVDSGDSYAANLVQEFRGQVMPTIQGLTPQRAERLLDLIDAESKLPKSRFAGLQISDRPFTDEDIEAGHDLFAGRKRFASGAPACLSCHTVRGVGGLGGGRLGPDLTHVYEKLGGRKALASWLLMPETTTMKPIYAKHRLDDTEILALTAYLEDRARGGGQADSVPSLVFFLLGLGGAVLGLVAFDVIWKGRFRAVRRPLVQGGRTGGEG